MCNKCIYWLPERDGRRQPKHAGAESGLRDRMIKYASRFARTASRIELVPHNHDHVNVIRCWLTCNVAPKHKKPLKLARSLGQFVNVFQVASAPASSNARTAKPSR